jgi:O-antigen/teichoic acid export membrane protein
MRNITLVSGILAILLPLLLLPDFGVYGAAISTSLALSFQNILSFFYVKKRLGFWTFTLSLK